MFKAAPAAPKKPAPAAKTLPSGNPAPVTKKPRKPSTRNKAAAPAEPHPKEPVKAPPPRHPGEALPIPGSPPVPLRQGEGKGELRLVHPERTVTLDAACFYWVWRIVEAKALINFNSATTRELLPEQVDVSLRTTAAFRRAYANDQERLDLTARPRKVLRRG